MDWSCYVTVREDILDLNVIITQKTEISPYSSYIFDFTLQYNMCYWNVGTPFLLITIIGQQKHVA